VKTERSGVRIPGAGPYKMYADIQSQDGKHIKGTPRDVASLMVNWLQIHPNQTYLKVLEPSAGTGVLLDALIEHGIAKFDVCELNEALRNGLREKYQVNPMIDCLKIEHQKYDRIIMNPPHKQDVEHLMHMHSLLKPEGRVVCLIHNTFKRSYTPRYIAFRKWLKGKTHQIISLDKVWFNNVVSATLIVIDRYE